MYVCALIAGLHESETELEARQYLSDSILYQDFSKFRMSRNDLYMLFYKYRDYKFLNTKAFIRFVNTMKLQNRSYSVVYPYLSKLYRELGINDAELMSVRATIARWDSASSAEKDRVLRIMNRRLRMELPLSDIKHLITNMQSIT